MVKLQAEWRRGEAPTGDRMILFASRLDAPAFPRRAWLARPLWEFRLLWRMLRIRRVALAAPGVIGVAILGRRQRGRYYTMSTWQDEKALHAFARHPHHRKAMRAFGTTEASGVLMSWWMPASPDSPGWPATLARLDMSPPTRYRGPEPEPGEGARSQADPLPWSKPRR